MLLTAHVGGRQEGGGGVPSPIMPPVSLIASAVQNLHIICKYELQEGAGKTPSGNHQKGRRIKT